MLLPFQIDELLSLRRDQHAAGAVVATVETVDLYEVMQVAITVCRPQTTAYPFRITVEPTDLKITTVRPWILRVISNFVSNAIAHSRGEHIELFVEAVNERVVINVRDNGRGMKADQLQRLYSKKFIGDISVSSTTTLGSGRGIVTSMLLVDAMQGKYHCETHKLGTHWRVYLPLQPPSPPRLPAILRENMAWLNGILHDIRTPINNLLARRVADQDYVVRAALARLQFLINEVCVIIQADMGLWEEVPHESFDLGDVLSAAVLGCRPLRSTSTCDVIAKPCHLSVDAPKTWVYRVAVDVLTFLADQADRVEVFSGYQDTPNGFVFLDFVSRSSSFQTTLVEARSCDVARALIAAMRGSIQVKRHSDRLVHRVRLPLRRVNAPLFRIGAPRDRLLDGKMVFILDDNVDLAIELAILFQEVGADAMVFTDELEMLTASQAVDPPPSLYLLDFMLGDSFSYNAVRVCSRKPEKPHVVMITSHPNHPGLSNLVPPIPVLTKSLSDLHFRALVALLRGEISDLAEFA